MRKQKFLWRCSSLFAKVKTTKKTDAVREPLVINSKPKVPATNSIIKSNYRRHKHISWSEVLKLQTVPVLKAVSVTPWTAVSQRHKHLAHIFPLQIRPAGTPCGTTTNVFGFSAGAATATQNSSSRWLCKLCGSSVALTGSVLCPRWPGEVVKKCNTCRTHRGRDLTAAAAPRPPTSLLES